MDDPISALDANVKRDIFHNVFSSHLKNKTRILVTHAIDYLHLVDKIILFDDGQIVAQGSFEELIDNPYLIKLTSITKSNKEQVVGKGEKASAPAREEPGQVLDQEERGEAAAPSRAEARKTEKQGKSQGIGRTAPAKSEAAL